MPMNNPFLSFGALNRDSPSIRLIYKSRYPPTRRIQYENSSSDIRRENRKPEMLHFDKIAVLIFVVMVSFVDGQAATGLPLVGPIVDPLLGPVLGPLLGPLLVTVDETLEEVLGGGLLGIL